jgi:signal transduction histidine kinase
VDAGEALIARVALVVVVVLGLLAEAMVYGPGDVGRWAPDLAVGWSLAGCGLVASRRRPASGTGLLLVAAGMAWFAGNFADVRFAPIAVLATQLTFLHRAVLMHAVLALPGGHLRSRVDAAAVGVGYLLWLFPPVATSVAALAAVGVLFTSVAAFDWQRAPAPARRPGAIATLAATVSSLAYVGAGAVHVAIPSGRLDWLALVGDESALITTGLLVTCALLLPRIGANRLTDLVIELRGPRSDGIRDALARAVGDPTLEVGYWHGRSGAYLDAAGFPLPLSSGDPRRARTAIDIDGEPVALLVHDPVTLEQASLRDSVRTMTRLAAANARLRGDVLDRLFEVRASRRRLLAAGDAERSALERRLHHGVLRRAEALRSTLPAAGEGSALARAGVVLDDALLDLRNLASGLHPKALDEAGLEGALESLAGASSIPVRLEIRVGDLPDGLALAVYFTCAEGLANAAKHSRATHAEVLVRQGPGSVVAEVRDWGAGGADLSRGTGLRGVADRIEALGGRFELRSELSGGTTVRAELPLEPRPVVNPEAAAR